jgi:HK97 gp10 family phage protein
MSDTRVDLNRREIKRLRMNPKVQARAKHDAEALANLAASLAPERTGAGARSIHAEGPFADGVWRVSWDDDHFYMMYQELGTSVMGPQPFMRPAVDHLSR